MQSRYISATLIAVAMFIGPTCSMAYEHVAERVPVVPNKSVSDAKSAGAGKAALAAKHKAVAKIKLVDINYANKAVLKNLPGITDVEAEKIIANRPYGSKAWLVTNKVVDAKTYGAIKTLIEAKQPYKSAEKNAVIYQKVDKK